MENKRKINQLAKELGDKVKFNEPLGRHTTFKIGGPADLFYEANTEEELVAVIRLSQELGVSHFILGGGSNLLISDKGYRGVVIKIRDTKYEIRDTQIITSSGTPLGKLIGEVANHSLSGLEFCVGIPGTIGGAIFGNSGVKEKAIGDVVEKVRVLNEKGEEIDFTQDQCQFDYRRSRFQKEPGVILEATLKLEKGEQSGIKKKMEAYFQARVDQPREPSAGSIFKNPPRQSAGELIEQVGLKGESEGQAQISEKHANWIVNLGGARCQDVLELLSLAKSKVRTKFGIELEEEIQIINEI